jgi:hypothetical protein
MNITASYKYQLKDMKNSIIGYYGTLIALFFVLLVLRRVMNGMLDPGTISGIEFVGVIFLGIAGLNSLRENFAMLSQNGVSRQSILAGHMLTVLTVSAFMAVADVVLRHGTILFAELLGSPVVFTSAFTDIYYNLNFFIIFMLSLGLYIFAYCVGYLIVSVFYRLNKAWRVVVGVGVPVFVFMLFPIIDTFLFESWVSMQITKFLLFAIGYGTGNPWYVVVTSIVGGVLCFGASWAIMRRAAVHE